MRVWCWTEMYWPAIGGLEVLVSRLLRSLGDLGHEFIVITGKDDPGKCDCDEFGNVAIHRFPFRQLASNKDITAFAEVARRLSRLRRDFAPELIHMHNVLPGAMFCVAASAKTQAPLLFTFHHCLPNLDCIEDTLFGRVMQSARWVTGCSAAVVKGVRSVMPQIADRSSVIYSGVEESHVQASPLPFDPPRILCLGRLWKGKGFDLAIRAVGLLQKRFPKVQLIISGDGSERGALEQLAVELGLEHSVDFLGWTDPRSTNGQAIWELINRSTMVVMPSRPEGVWVEGLGMVAIEGSIMERPVVASNSGGLPEVVEDGKTGILVEENDLDGLVGAIAALLENPSMAREMGRAGRRRSLEKFNWDKHVVAEYNALYHKLTTEV